MDSVLKHACCSDAYFDDMRFENGEYASKMAYHWSNASSLPWEESSTSTWDPVELYRKVLANQKNQSVTIASIGFLDNVHRITIDSRDLAFHLCTTLNTNGETERENKKHRGGKKDKRKCKEQFHTQH